MEKQQIEKYKDTRNLRPHPKRSGRFHSANRLSVMAIFRNEAHLFKEWIEHYYSEGVQHFYLINHNLFYLFYSFMLYSLQIYHHK